MVGVLAFGVCLCGNWVQSGGKNALENGVIDGRKPHQAVARKAETETEKVVEAATINYLKEVRFYGRAKVIWPVYEKAFQIEVKGTLFIEPGKDNSTMSAPWFSLERKPSARLKRGYDRFDPKPKYWDEIIEWGMDKTTAEISVGYQKAPFAGRGVKLSLMKTKTGWKVYREKGTWQS
jgi:hypothetical protein